MRFVFLRDAALNAKGYFERFTPAGDGRSTREKAPYSQEQFGGTLGGPIERDRMFFFGSFERLDVDDQQRRHHRRHYADPAPGGADSARRSTCSGEPVSRSRPGNVPYAVEVELSCC